MTALGYIQTVNQECVAVGVAHISIGTERAKPILACGADSGSMNWTLNPKTKQPVCNRCKIMVSQS